MTQELARATRQFFALATPAAEMPQTQLDQFAAQAFARHYRVALFFRGEEAPLAGTLTRQLTGGRYLFQAYRSNLYRVVQSDQLTYIQKV
ncbi:hypothetical protein [Lacticaseibacillus mingshuiensis]